MAFLRCFYRVKDERITIYSLLNYTINISEERCDIIFKRKYNKLTKLAYG